MLAMQCKYLFDHACFGRWHSRSIPIEFGCAVDWSLHQLQKLEEDAAKEGEPVCQPQSPAERANWALVVRHQHRPVFCEQVCSHSKRQPVLATGRKWGYTQVLTSLRPRERRRCSRGASVTGADETLIHIGRANTKPVISRSSR